MNDSFEKVTSVARLQPTGGKIKGSALNGITHTHNTLLSLLLDGQNFHNPPPPVLRHLKFNAFSNDSPATGSWLALA